MKQGAGSSEQGVRDAASSLLAAPCSLLNPSSLPYDAVLIVSFGGPEGPDDVLPFLENVTRGRNIPRDRLLEVAEHYELFGGVSPLNGEIRTLLTRLIAELNAHGPHLPVYWGNRNWHPLLTDVVQQMADDDIRRALAFVTSAFGSYSGCRQYREDIARARQEVGAGAPQIDVIRRFYNHPGFIDSVLDRVRAAREKLPEDRREGARLIFTAHSIPEAMANSGPYEAQLREACRLVAEALPNSHWQLAFQSRSGPPSQPWLGPDIESVVRSVAAEGPDREVVISPIGFLNDHMEVIFDLDVEIAELCEELHLTMIRAETPGSHPRFIEMIRELIAERVNPGSPRLALGPDGPPPDGPTPLECSPGCCLMERKGKPGEGSSTRRET
jgi:protoporphyrin/coproporphyrin ferrochelatase